MSATAQRKHAGSGDVGCGKTPIDKIQSALGFVQPHDRDVWVKVGMAVHAELGEDGFWLWDNWSQGAESYHAASAKSVWKSFRRGKVGIGTLFYAAKQNGWAWDKPEKRLTAAEVEAMKQASRLKAEAAAAEKAREQAAAADLAAAIWNEAQPATEHPYLTRKGVKAHGLRVGKWDVVNHETGEIRTITPLALLVPIKDRTGRIHSLQAIYPRKVGDRDKDYLKSGAKAGHFHAIGKPKEHDGRKVWVLAEGYATGASLHECTGHAVLVCFDAGNLLPVAASIRERQSDALILIAADDDRWTRKPDGTPYNPGVKAATEAAQEVGGHLAVPRFASLDGEPTDWNDLHQREGSVPVIEQIFKALKAGPIAIEEDPAAEPSPADASRPEQGVETQEAAQDETEQGFDDLMAAVRKAGTKDELVALADTIKTQRMRVADIAVLSGEFMNAFKHVTGATLTKRQVDEMLAPKKGRAATKDVDENDECIRENPHFRVLGHKRKVYYFYQYRKRQVLEYTGRDLSTSASLIELAELSWWEGRYPGSAGGINRDTAVNALLRIAEERGVYDDTRRRGRGAWWDRGRFVAHLGNRLLVDGQDMPLGAIKSSYVYEAGTLLADLHDAPLSSQDGKRLLEIAKKFRWEKKVAADLLCGWIFLAPICGALKWRPHVWLTGSAGSGKTSIVSEFSYKLIPEGVPIFGNGDSTEAGFRQELDSDARPILIDESESDDMRARSRIENIIAMLRQSSSDSGAKTYRGSAGGKPMSFLVRSMAMLSSIGIALKQQQDIERIAVLALKSKRDDDGDAPDWASIKSELKWISDDSSISERVFRRAVDMVPIIAESIDRFSKVIADHPSFGTQRHGDQYGTLLAGCWCLTHDRAPTADEAASVVAEHDWGEHQAKHGEEPEDLMATLLGCPVVLERGVRTSIGVLIAIAAGRQVEDERLKDLTFREANAQLHTYGMKVTADVLRVHPSNKQLEHLLANTKFATGLHERMKRIKGASTWGGKTFRIGEASKNGVHIPIDTVFAASDEEKEAEALPSPHFNPYVPDENPVFDHHGAER